MLNKFWEESPNIVKSNFNFLSFFFAPSSIYRKGVRFHDVSMEIVLENCIVYILFERISYTHAECVVPVVMFREMMNYRVMLSSNGFCSINVHIVVNKYIKYTQTDRQTLFNKRIDEGRKQTIFCVHFCCNGLKSWR